MPAGAMASFGKHGQEHPNSARLLSGSVIQNLQEVKKRGPVSNLKVVIGVNSDNSQTGKVKEGLNDWVTDLCGWTSHVCEFPCLCGFCCTCCASPLARTNYDGSNICFNVLCTNLCVNRSIIREGQYNIQGNCINDVMESMCCPFCVATQLLLEVQRRGVVKVQQTTDITEGPGASNMGMGRRTNNVTGATYLDSNL